MNAKAFFNLIYRPICFLAILGISIFLFWRLYFMSKQSEESITTESRQLVRASTLGIETTAKLLAPLNSSAMNFARALSSSLNGTELSSLDIIQDKEIRQLSFGAIQAKVAPTLFLALSTIPYISQSSYIGQNGLIFSFYKKDEDLIVALFSNTSSSSPNWYTQPVDRDSGELYGEAVAANPTVTRNASWFQKALKSTSGYSWLGDALNNSGESLFLSAVAMDGRGVISLGLPAKVVVEFFAALDFFDGFHLATKDGDVIIHARLPDTHIYVINDTVSLQVVDPDGAPRGHPGYFSCASDDARSTPFDKKVSGKEFFFYCSTLEIAGVETVYVLALPTKGVVSLIQRNSKISILILLILFVSMVISICVFLFFIIRAAKREMSLCAALVKQMDATQQAERKSMNKSQAFAAASHDIRGSLAAITALIDICSQDCNTDKGLKGNLSQMSTCTKDLHGLLNSVLDTSKIEAGKMKLEEEEFDLAQLLEDVVDMFYPVAMKKGVDIVLDPCDDSISKSRHVRGDRGKLKQILCNLLSNAVKFTSEGHITVRATVQETSLENAIIASTNYCPMLESLCQLCPNNKKRLNDLDALRTAQQAPNLTQFVIEVDDTGLGIPKDKQNSVFEFYNQVEDSAFRKGGTGLGLGIVQSLVRLMGGDIRIVDKRAGEKGTCFNIDFKLATYEVESTDNEGLQSVRGSPKQDGSHVILLMEGDQRRKLLMKYIESLNIRVSYVKQGKNLLPLLEKIRQNLDDSYFSSYAAEKTHMGLVDLNEIESDFKSDLGSNIDDHIVSSRSNSKRSSSTGIMLFVVDASAGPFSELSSAMIYLRKGIHNSRCKVVWLDHPTVHVARSVHPPPYDYIMYKPLHGSRLRQVLGLIPELKSLNFPELVDKCEALEMGESSSHQSSLKHDDISTDNRLNGKKALVVEDHAVIRQATVRIIRKLGAEVEMCENGKEAFDRICKLLSDQRKEGDSISPLPYDYVFMDCEMPVMNGFEATRLVRAEEVQYGIHIPIIALTAHIEPELVRRMFQNGMDWHLPKPFSATELMEVIRHIDTKQ